MKKSPFCIFFGWLYFKKRKSEKISEFLKPKKYYVKCDVSIMVMVGEHLCYTKGIILIDCIIRTIVVFQMCQDHLIAINTQKVLDLYYQVLYFLILNKYFLFV